MPDCQHCGTAIDASASACPTCGRHVSTGNQRAENDRGGGSQRRIEGQARAAGQADGGPGPTQARAAGTASRRTGAAGRVGREQTPESAGRRREGAGRRGRPERRPAGISVVAAVVAFVGVSMIGLALWLLDMGGTASGVGASGPGSTLTIVGVLTGLFGLGYLVVAGGLWTLRPWAWQATVAILAIGSLGTFLMVGSGYSGIGTVLALLVNLGALGYLVTQRRAFVVASRARHGGGGQ